MINKKAENTSLCPPAESILEKTALLNFAAYSLWNVEVDFSIPNLGPIQVKANPTILLHDSTQNQNGGQIWYPK